MTVIDVIHFKENNRKLVSVPIAGKPKWKAVLYEQDFNDLMTLGISPKWKLLHNQVIVRNNNRNIAISRLIRHAGVRERVVCLDDDPCNLRRDNLVLTEGGSAKYEARSNIVKAFKPKDTVEHIRQ